MSSQATCQACGARPATDAPLLRLTTTTDAPAERALTLCEACLDRRETEVWPRDGADGKRLCEALEDLDGEPTERYTYLLGDAEVHLVRLRPDWVDQHAAPAPP